MQPDANEHRGDKHEHVGLPGIESDKPGPRANAGKSPTNAENNRTCDEFFVEILFTRQVETDGKKRFMHHTGILETGDGNQECPGHDKSQCRIPGAQDIQESKHSGRVDHFRNTQSQAKQDTAAHQDQQVSYRNTFPDLYFLFNLICHDDFPLSGNQAHQRMRYHG